MSDPIDESVDPADAGSDIAADLDQDGVVETVVSDVNRDGIADSVTWENDDGSISAVVDEDSSGGFDVRIDDTDGDFEPDSVVALQPGDTVTLPGGTELTIGADTVTQPIVSDGVPGGDGADGPVILPGLPDPDADLAPADTDDPVHGEATDEIQYWREQTENGLCAPNSVAMIVEEFSGVELPEQAFVDAAVGLGLLDDTGEGWSGMNVYQTEQLIEHFGIPAHVEQGTIETLEGYLDEGRDVILAVDSSEIWFTGDDDAVDSGMGADHAVVITEIDEANGVVYLNDPGQPGGAGYEIPIDELVDAWQDGANAMVVTDGAPEGTTPLPQRLEPSSPDAPDGPGIGEFVGFVVLPVIVVAGLLKPRRKSSPAQ